MLNNITDSIADNLYLNNKLGLPGPFDKFTDCIHQSHYISLHTITTNDDQLKRNTTSHYAFFVNFVDTVLNIAANTRKYLSNPYQYGT